jgi:hypothetical protein
MANPYRGEAALDLDGRYFTLRLTLGALAELETAFGVEGLAGLGERLSAGKLAARDLLRLLGPLVRGGGQHLGEGEIASLITARDLPQVVAAIAACFAAAMPPEAADIRSASPEAADIRSASPEAADIRSASPEAADIRSDPPEAASSFGVAPSSPW